MPTRLYRMHSGVWVPNTGGSPPPPMVTGRVHYSTFAANAPVAPPGTFLWGFQQFPTGTDYMKSSQETPAQQYARHLAVYGRDDIQKLFYGGNLPGTWNAAREGVNTGTKHVMVCHNTGAPTPAGVSQILSGQYDSLLRSYWRSIPANRTVELVWNQEADGDLLPSEGGTGGSGQLTKAQFKNGFNYQAQLLHDDIQAGNVAATVYAHANFMNAAFRQNVWTDDRVPNKADRISWDTYLNPPPAIDSSPPDYETTGAASAAGAAALHSAAAARILDQFGNSYAGRWGWAEIGAPWRINDTSGNARAATWTNLINALEGTDAYFGIIWDSDVGQWDHRIMKYNMSPAPSPTPSNAQGVWPGPGAEPSIAAIIAAWS